ncbi:hypothetical protein NFI96_001653, partial [Prochilodus magdalenae]
MDLEKDRGSTLMASSTPHSSRNFTMRVQTVRRPGPEEKQAPRHCSYGVRSRPSGAGGVLSGRPRKGTPGTLPMSATR